MVWHELRRRRRKHIGAGVALVALLALTLVPLFQHQEPAVAASVAHTPPKREPLQIRQLTDDQLLAELQGTPLALMQWPDGNRTLFVIESTRRTP